MKLRDLVENLERPADYFAGLEWGSELLPEKILCFKRLQQDHTTNGWEGISAKAGRYDQHGRYVLLMALEGEGKLGVESEVWPVKIGQALVLFPHQVHYYVELAETFCWLFVSFLSRKFHSLMENFLARYHTGDALSSSVALAAVLQDLGKGVQSQLPTESVEGNSIVARVKRYVMGNLEGGLSNPELAEEMRVSESYLRAMFRDETGVSMAHFVRSARLVRASHLLDETDLSMAETAERCGFQSVTSFTRAFRRTYHMTPSNYRKRNG